MPTVNIQCHLEPKAAWHFVKDPDCKHELTTKFTVGTYIDGPNSGTMYGLKCKGCKALKY